MKAKLFTETIGTAQSGINAFSFEQEINKWLAENPEIEITDVRLSACNLDKNLQALCLVLYQEKQ